MSFAEIVLALIAAGGGGAAIALGVIRAFGEKWLDGKFANRLQDLRHEHERRMEVIKLEASQSLDRLVRLSEREFETTAEAWRLVTDAYVRTIRALPGYRESVDFSKLSDKLARIAASQSEFAEWEIEALLEKPKEQRNQFFNDRVSLNDLSGAKRAIGAANGYLARNALFLDQQIHGKLEDFLAAAWKATVAWGIVLELRHQGEGIAGLEGIRRDDDEFRQTAEAKIKELEGIVRSRFWPTSGAVAEKD